jgi:hypothetical protein
MYKLSKKKIYRRVRKVRKVRKTRVKGRKNKSFKRKGRKLRRNNKSIKIGGADILKCSICNQQIVDFTKRIEEITNTVNIFYHEPCFIQGKKDNLVSLAECQICKKPIYNCQKYIELKTENTKLNSAVFDDYKIQFPSGPPYGPYTFAEYVEPGIYHEKCLFGSYLNKINGAENLNDIGCKFCGEKVNNIQYRWAMAESPNKYYHGHWIFGNVGYNLKRCYMKVQINKFNKYELRWD